MNIAIYPRKSKFSPTSESIANQVAMCREYCDRCFDDPHYLVYDEDEGFSGKSTNRPAYTQMIEDMRAGKFQVLCCYRLDRISRNVRDFAELLDDLQRHNIAFVSVRNNFDTST
ncbi:recombinase family protein, partial [Gemmiger formicilis]|uniref:recombinase family protein n=1 Tax=Gemmiger formicilis TaxID=745368 RepID=UPI003AB4AF94